MTVLTGVSPLLWCRCVIPGPFGRFLPDGLRCLPRVLWVLLAAVPAVFIVFATALAPGSQVRLTLDETGRQMSKMVNLVFGAGDPPRVHSPDGDRVPGHTGL